jgi:uncharacterized surface protein with fasciclin (FAS1) repeats
MRQSVISITTFILLLFVFGCTEKWEEYYARPDWLEGPIYQQLEKEGRFTTFMSLLEYMGYDDILGKTGYFTLFAPNDSAFDVFFKSRNINAVEDLDTALIRDIVQYALVENGYTPHTLAAYQSSNGWVEGLSFRRLTRSSGKYYKTTFYDNDGIRLYSSGGTSSFEGYIKNEGVKYIPYFLDEFFTTTGISPANYNKYFPEVEYTGFNVADARVLGDYIVAENGYIYELDKVLLPLPNLDEYLIEHPEKDRFTEFRKILLMVTDTCPRDYLDVSKDLPVYYKVFEDGIFPDPNIEEYSTSSNVYQTICFTMFAPDNNSLQEFYSNKFLKYYSTLDQLAEDRLDVIIDFVNSHLVVDDIWYTDLPSYESSFGVLLGDNNIISGRMASNGIFYGISEVLQTGNYFNSVYGEICLNPEHKNFYMAIKLIKEINSLRNLLTSREIDYTLFLTNDSVFAAGGYFYYDLLSAFYPLSTGEEDVTETVNLMIVRGDYNNLSGKGFLKTLGGGIIRYDNNVIWGGGNIENNAPSHILETNNEPINGTVYKVNKNLIPPAKSYLEVLAAPPAGASYSQFNLYLTNSGLISSGAITGVQTRKGITIVVPTDDAVIAAGLPAYTATDSVSKETIKNFLLYHIFQDVKYPEEGTYKTYNVSEVMGKFNVYREITTAATTDGFEITDGTGNKASVINIEGSCNFALEGACIYQIDKVLNYE